MSDLLEIFTLGGFSLRWKGEPLPRLGSRKDEALLIYLACTGRSQPRELLMDLLWDDLPQSRAQANLRVALSHLRKQFKPYLNISRGNAAVNQDANVWLDRAKLEEGLQPVQDQEGKVSPPTASQLEQVLELYRGDFLAGFYVRGCRSFEEWMVRERERLHREVVDALIDLVTFETERRDYKSGITHATRLLEIDPLTEVAHRNLMRLLAYSGQRAAALEQYETCRQNLADELGVEPVPETVELYRQIQSGDLVKPGFKSIPVPIPALEKPAFLDAGVTTAKTQEKRFVARERELERLDEYLAQASIGEGKMVFITGEAGSGKSALMDAFARRATKAHSNLLVAFGNCNAYTGVGDPFLPFRDVLGMLTGELESRWAAGAINTEIAQRLWNSIPLTIQVLLDYGPDLFGVFALPKKVLESIGALMPESTTLFERAQEMVRTEQSILDVLEKKGLFEQYTQVLHNIAREKILMIILDDLQWVDRASTSLLFHLGHRLAGEKILILGAYRMEDVALGKNGRRHPLGSVLSEFKRQYGDVWIDLGEIDPRSGYEFVNRFLDSEPNRLGESFRQALYERTGGQPLFTIELLRGLEERGELAKDKAGRWIESKKIHWGTVPARVEGVIEERIERLDPEQQEVLSLAAVEGVTATIQLIARVLERDEISMIRMISRDLDAKHRLLEAAGSQQVGSQTLHNCRFRHFLFQQYLYDRLGDLERQLLHAEIAQALEAIFGDLRDEIAVQLAHHWLRASQAEKALPYILQAGDQFRKIYAHDEAEQYYRQAVEILDEIGREEEKVRTLMKLGLVYTADFQPEKAREAYNQSFSLLETLHKNEILEEPDVPSKTLCFAVEEPFTIDPGLISDDVSAFLARQLFEGLVCIDPEYNVLPAAASDWSVSDDGRRYVFHLREDCSWCDGTPLTASDFEFAWKRNLNPDTRSSAANLLYPILNARAYAEGKISEAETVGVRAVDDLTLEVNLEQPTAYLLHLLIHTVTFPLPRHAIQSNGKYWAVPGKLIGNGAYELVEWQRGKKIVLQRNPYYKGRFPGNIERVECPIISEFTPAFDKYSAGDLDGMSMITADPGNVARARALFRDELVFIPQPSTLYLFLRADKPPIDDLDVRQALIHAVDRTALVKEVFQVPGQYMPATGGFLPTGMPGCSPGIGLPYEPEKARELLSRAGYPDGKGFPDTTFLYSGGSIYDKVVPFLLSAWRENLGLNLAAESLDWSTFMERLESDPAQITVIGWSADYLDPDGMLRILFHGTEGVYQGCWYNSRFNTLVEAATRINDQKQRIELYQQADRILVVDEAVVMPLGHLQARILKKPWVVIPWIRPVQMCFKDVIVERRLYL